MVKTYNVNITYNDTYIKYMHLLLQTHHKTINEMPW